MIGDAPRNDGDESIDGFGAASVLPFPVSVVRPNSVRTSSMTTSSIDSTNEIDDVLESIPPESTPPLSTSVPPSLVSLPPPRPSPSIPEDSGVVNLAFRRLEEGQKKRSGRIPFRISLDGIASLLERSVSLRFDEALGKTVLVERPPWDSDIAGPIPRRWTKREQIVCTRWIEQQLGEDVVRCVSIEDATEAIVARPEMRIDSVRSAVFCERWDGVSRIDRLATRFGLQDGKKQNEAIQAWIAEIARRVSHPGDRLRRVLLVDEVADLDRYVELLSSLVPAGMFAELGMEMDARYTSSHETLVGSALGCSFDVSYLTDRAFQSLVSYATRASDGNDFPPRRCGFALLSSERTPRIPARCDRVKAVSPVGELFSAFEAGQLFAEALHLFGEKRPGGGTGDTEEDDAYDMWTPKIAKFLRDDHGSREGGYVSTGYVLEKCLRIPMERWSSNAERRVVRVLRSLGYVKPNASGKVTINGIRVRVFIPTEKSVDKGYSVDTSSGVQDEMDAKIAFDANDVARHMSSSNNSIGIFSNSYDGPGRIENARPDVDNLDVAHMKVNNSDGL